MTVLARLLVLLLLLNLTGPALAADEAKARSLLNSLGCKGCHSFEGSGGSLGPALDGVGGRLDREQIQGKLLRPKTTNPASKMPAYGHLASEDLAALIDFLAARK